jgi:hypothetical protein
MEGYVLEGDRRTVASFEFARVEKLKEDMIA